MPRLSYIFYPGDASGPITLGDDTAGARVSGGLPSQKRNVTSIPLFRASRMARRNSGNVEESITWSVDRDHGNAAAAFSFRRDHADSIPNVIGMASGTLQELESESGSSRFLQKADLVGIVCKQWDGQSTVYEYTATGSQWTDTMNP